MSTTLNEWLQKTIAELEEERDAVPGAVNEDALMALAAMKIALASLEAEPVAYIGERMLADLIDGARSCGRIWPEVTDKMSGEDRIPLFLAPPAPASVPDEVIVFLNHLEDVLPDEAFNLIDVKTWNNVSMLSRPDVYRAAMLQGAEPVSNRDELPDDWVACSERIPENDDFVYVCPRPDFGVELHVAQYGKFDKRDAGWYAQLYEQNYGIEYRPIIVTHWQPLPLSPAK